jgi:ribosomal protein L39E
MKMNDDFKVLKKRMNSVKGRQNRRVPLFVTARTKREVTENPKRRNWRTQKLGIQKKKLKKKGIIK